MKPIGKIHCILHGLFNRGDSRGYICIFSDHVIFLGFLPVVPQNASTRGKIQNPNMEPNGANQKALVGNERCFARFKYPTDASRTVQKLTSC